MRIAMPSPRGTNHERLFISRRSAEAAYDSDPDGNDDTADIVKNALRELASKMTAEEWSAMYQQLRDETEMASDNPPNFPGKPIPGGGMVAQDGRHRAGSTGARNSYDAAFPEAARLGHR